MTGKTTKRRAADEAALSFLSREYDRHPEVLAPLQAQPAYIWLRCAGREGRLLGLLLFEARFTRTSG
jgi:hypothetical protein